MSQNESENEMKMIPMHNSYSGVALEILVRNLPLSAVAAFAIAREDRVQIPVDTSASDAPTVAPKGGAE